MPNSKKAASKRHPRKGRQSEAHATHSDRTTFGLWSGTLSFGLVSIPVELYSATHSTRHSLNMLSPDGTRLLRRYFSEQGKPLTDEDIARGYALDDGRYVVVEDEELERLLPEQSRDIDLTRFVATNAIPSLYFERAYIMAPASGSSSAYRLLASTMEKLEKTGIASFVMRDRQYVVAISARDGLLRAETLRFEDELRTPESVGLPAHKAPSAARLREMKAAIKGLSKGDLAERELKDSYWQRLEQLVAHKKKRGQDVVAADKSQPADDGMGQVIDLMEVLRKSLAQQDAPKPARKTAVRTQKTPRATTGAHKKGAHG